MALVILCAFTVDCKNIKVLRALLLYCSYVFMGCCYNMVFEFFCGTFCHLPVLVKANRLILSGKGFLIHCTSLTALVRILRGFILFGGSSFDRISVLTSLKSLQYCLVIL